MVMWLCHKKKLLQIDGEELNFIGCYFEQMWNNKEKSLGHWAWDFSFLLHVLSGSIVGQNGWHWDGRIDLIDYHFIMMLTPYVLNSYEQT